MAHKRGIARVLWWVGSVLVKVLVLGGTHHVGRCVVEEALALGHDVTTLNRGTSPHYDQRTERLVADRFNDAEVDEALGARRFDLAVDTWSGAPRVVLAAARRLHESLECYVYVSSRSVYEWPIAANLDESGPLVDGRSDSDTTEYAAAKRGGELAVIETFADRAVVLRPGLILGPYEIVGRLPWWLRRIEAGGRILAPGPMNRRLQYIDGRDLAKFALGFARDSPGGVYNTVSRTGHTTMGELLESARENVNPRAEFVWLSAAEVLENNIAPWSELPIWLPPTGESSGLHDGNVEAAMSRGLSCRSIDETVRDTWTWMCDEAFTDMPNGIGLDPDRERDILTRLGSQ